MEWAIVLATLVGPLSAVLITLWHQDRSASRERKTQLLRQLMFTRHLPGDPNYSIALTMIPLEFAKHSNVIAKYREVKAELNNPSALIRDETIGKLVDLILCMASVLGYKYDHADMRASGFVSSGLIERDRLYLASLQAQVDTAAHIKRSVEVSEGIWRNSALASSSATDSHSQPASLDAPKSRDPERVE